MKKPRILLTSGATREPIDGVRFITNFSTGQTGAELADAFQAAGYPVLLLAGEGAVAPEKAEFRRYSSFQDLDAKLREVLGAQSFDAIIHLAAVSDYSVASVEADGA